MSKVYIRAIPLRGNDSYPDTVTLYSHVEISTPVDDWEFISTIDINDGLESGSYSVYIIKIYGSVALLQSAFEFLKEHDFSICYDFNGQALEVDDFNDLVRLVKLGGAENEIDLDDDVLPAISSGPSLK